MSEFVCKRKTPAKGSWSSWRTPRETENRRAIAHGENVDFICWYLYNNPGARYTEVLRALCTRNGVEYVSGQYSNYFNSGFGGHGHVGRLWQRVSSGWMLTLDGMLRYGEWCV